VARHFLTVGTHAVYAYETADGVRVVDGALATQDVDMLFDTRKRLTFFSALREENLSFIGLVRKADKTFRVREDQLQTAVNAKGFEVDVIRRMATMAPEAFVRVKAALAKNPNRDPLKRDKDVLQARIVQALIDERGIALRGTK